MRIFRRAKARDSVIAGAALETLNERARSEAGMATLASLAPGWRNDRPHAIRLIDLERRAQFGRLLGEPR